MVSCAHASSARAPWLRPGHRRVPCDTGAWRVSQGVWGPRGSPCGGLGSLVPRHSRWGWLDSRPDSFAVRDPLLHPQGQRGTPTPPPCSRTLGPWGSGPWAPGGTSWCLSVLICERLPKTLSQEGRGVGPPARNQGRRAETPTHSTTQPDPASHRDSKGHTGNTPVPHRVSC